MNNVTVTGTLIDGNGGDGVYIRTRDHFCPNNITAATFDTVFFDTVTVTNNVGSGVEVASAPGISRMNNDGTDPNMPCQAPVLTSVPLSVPTEGYGFRLETSKITNNMENGVLIAAGSNVQDQVLARIGGSTMENDIAFNQEAGVAMGFDEGGPRTGATITNNRMRENGGPGFLLGSSVIVPFDTSGLGFKQNLINHNAMSAAGCVATQSAAQIFIIEPTAIDGSVCDADGTSSGDCADDSAPGTNAHCVFSTDAGRCFVAHDLRGSLTTGGCANANKIFGYSTGPGPLDVGARAEAPAIDTPSIVDLRDNAWVGSPKTTVGGGSYILADPNCGAIGCTP
jgi:hypothetical protein